MSFKMNSQIYQWKTLTLNPILWLRIATGIVGTLMVSVSLVGVALMYLRLHQVCTAPLQMCLTTFQLVPSNLVGIESPEWVLHFHAVARTVTQLAGRLPFWILAGLIVRRRTHDALGLITVLWLFTYGAPFDLFTAASEFPFLMPLVQFLFPLGTLCFGLFLTLFPYGQFVPRWSIIVVGLWLVNAIANFFPSLSTATTQADQYRFLIINTIQYGGVALLQIYRYRKLSNAVERQQTKWVVYGMVVWFTLSSVTRWLVAQSYDPTATVTLQGYLIGIGFPLAALTLPVSVTIAILRSRLFDIDILINRSLVYATLTLFVITVYGLIVGYFSSIFRSDNTLLSLVATGFIAILFQPLRESLQRTVNRLMYGQRDDPYEVLSRLGQQLETAVAPATLLASIVQTLVSTLKLPYAAITMKDGDGLRNVASAGQPVPTPLTFPLRHQNEIVGQLLIGPRAAGEPFSAADRRLIEQIARQSGVVMYSLQLTEELQSARERLVTAREEERRRLRRDLHDGLGPQLASQTLTLDAVSKLLTTDPAAAVDLVRALKQQSQDAIGDIRRLVYDLRPPALDDLGLVAALREQTARYQHTGIRFTLSAPEPLPALSAAVEVAAYRIAQEALTNVVRHSHAQTCQIALAMNSAFHLTIEDNGCGLACDYRSGVGLHSMRERAEELGGACLIEQASQGGTRVYARLPLAREE